MLTMRSAISQALVVAIEDVLREKGAPGAASMNGGHSCGMISRQTQSTCNQGESMERHKRDEQGRSPVQEGAMQSR